MYLEDTKYGYSLDVRGIVWRHSGDIYCDPYIADPPNRPD